ncbi:hypothetical protein [Nocardioides sp.]|uniref:hypothetical protein n=1 Tax=Nocardioides sp. TaxID=35761 RepID=UPI00356B4E28
MNSEETGAEVGTEPGTEPGTDTGSAAPADAGAARPPDWWHRDHPTFTALTGFFTGLAFILLVPALYAGVLSLFVSTETVEDLFPFVLVTLVVPLGLVISTHTRRFGAYMWLGLVSTGIVVGGVGSLVLWALFSSQA